MIQTFRGLAPPVQVSVMLMVMVTILTIFGAGFWALMRASDGDLSKVQWGQSMLWLTTISGFAIQAWREARNRGWAIDDRKRASDAQTADIVAKARAEAEALVINTEAKAKALHYEAMAVAENIRLESLKAAMQVREEQRINTEEMLNKLAEVKEEAKKTYTEANHANMKIEKTAEQIADLNKRLLAKTDDEGKLDKLQDTANTVEDKVDEVREHQKKRDAKPKSER